MFKGKEVENAIRNAYSCLFPEKKDRKEALARLDMDKLVQSIRFRGENPPAYHTGGSADLSMKYRGPDLFRRNGFCVFREPVQAYSTMVEGTYFREIWLLENGAFVEVSAVRVDCRFTTESFYTLYRTVRRTMTKKDWRTYIPGVIAESFEDISAYPFDGEKGIIYEV